MTTTNDCTAESGTCETCRFACTHKPGWFLPGEAEKAAELLGLTLEEFFRRYLAVDWWASIDTDSDIFLLSPAVVGAPTGEEFPANPKGTCVFYRDGLCTIHAAKPHECRTWYCGSADAEVQTLHGDTARAWTDHRDQIVELLGREPESAEYSIFDAILGDW